MTTDAVPHSALLLVDVQNDFCTGGTLAVPQSGQVIEALNRHIVAAETRGMPVYASRDWHPATTSHFKAYGGVWPVHCVQNTTGAAFHPALRLPADTIVVTKGDRAGDHGYSAFQGTTATGETLLADLRRRGIGHLYVGGLATDYCVRASVLDALDAGLQVTVLEDAIAGVDVNAGDSERARVEMRTRGARFGEGGAPAPPRQ